MEPDGRLKHLKDLQPLKQGPPTNSSMPGLSDIRLNSLPGSGLDLMMKHRWEKMKRGHGLHPPFGSRLCQRYCRTNLFRNSRFPKESSLQRSIPGQDKSGQVEKLFLNVLQKGQVLSRKLRCN